MYYAYVEKRVRFDMFFFASDMSLVPIVLCFLIVLWWRYSGEGT